MAGKKRGLSKGLDALLADTLDLTNVTKKDLHTPPSNPAPLQMSAGFVELNVKQLQPGKFQPRREIQPEELQSLADSIKEQGIIQPIVVRNLSGEGYEIIAGERRWRAAQLADMQKVPVIIKDVPDEAALVIALIENIQRENLNPLEEAIALERLGGEFGLSHEKIAAAVGKSRTTITNLLRVLNLRVDVKKMLEKRQIELGHAKVLLALQGPLQSKIAREVVDKHLSVRATEHLVARAIAENDAPKITKSMDPDLRRLESNLTDKVGCPVKILQATKGKGKLVIRYNSLDELDGLIGHIMQN